MMAILGANGTATDLAILFSCKKKEMLGRLQVFIDYFII